MKKVKKEFVPASIRIEIEDFKPFKKIADDNRRSINFMVNFAIKKFLKEVKK